MHIFVDAGGGNILAFVELPYRPAIGRDENTPPSVQHLALQVSDEASLQAAKAHIEAQGSKSLAPFLTVSFDPSISSSRTAIESNSPATRFRANRG
jgi:hypothetical protein